MIKVLHFADAHIDIANYGRHDPSDGLPVRIKDFLASLDVIVQTALDESVDLVLFAGDAFKDRHPSPTFQREWAKRIRKLSEAEIETVIVIGNHDRSASIAHANALEVYQTLEIPHIHIVSTPRVLQPADLNGLQVNLVVIPWMMREDMQQVLEMTSEEIRNREVQVYQDLLTQYIENELKELDQTLPTILTAHGTVESAIFGEEKNIAIGGEFILPLALLKNPLFDYVALGHIHHAQDLNAEGYPPIIYAGSIERVSFSEANEKKYFVRADVEKGQTTFEWRELANIRAYVDIYVNLRGKEELMPVILEKIPTDGSQDEAVVRMILEYDQAQEAMIDDVIIRKAFESAFSFNLVKRPILKNRIRLGEETYVADLQEEDLLRLYWDSKDVDEVTLEQYLEVAKQIIQTTKNGE